MQTLFMHTVFFQLNRANGTGRLETYIRKNLEGYQEVCKPYLCISQTVTDTILRTKIY